ncbi:MAG: hypothetical protein A4E19_12015 [Nitrospira sp. SG-bin1]|nr:MAG: hypothetical protein A4E19_12015 [Nitrospira sp. SG-bin1]
MSPDASKSLTVVRQQLDELDAIAQQTLQDLNTVAGTERIVKWKARTVALITDAVGPLEGQVFARIQPGPSFTNDLVEEFTDLVECYRSPLKILAGHLAQPPSTGS